MAKLLATLREIDKESIWIQDTLKILASLNEPEVLNNLDRLAETISKVDQKKLQNLNIRVKFSIYVKLIIFSTPGEYFSSSLLLFENMALDHLQPYYEEAFANVKLKDVEDKVGLYPSSKDIK